MNTVSSFSVFKADPFGHGGEKRTHQINEIVALKCHISPVLFPDRSASNSPPLLSRLKRSSNLMDVLPATQVYKQDFSITRLLNESHRFFLQKHFLTVHSETISNCAAVVWQNNLPSSLYLPYLIKKEFSKKVVAVPHNLEALVANQSLRWYGKTRMSKFQHELESLRHCDKVYTVSEEEQWLLNTFDITARFLPYYPTGKLLDTLLATRRKREFGVRPPGSYFLIVGSITNPPTRTGMERLLGHLRSINKKRNVPTVFIVTGFGTDNLRQEFESEHTRIVGATSPEQLAELMHGCKAVVISQGYSSGALTKIPEMLIAGIPVLVDEGGARTYRRTDGVYVYESFQDLGDYFDCHLSAPAIPRSPQNKLLSFQNEFQ